ncbi:hypothetical protein [Streptomyces sp. NPDC007063]|uniref:hypothetical protein n=1 Tax=Streptomyces sp. NPDC007063 TaxID=3364772 RepID=UPI00367F4B52
MRLPDEQLRAGHIPADLYRQIPSGTHAGTVVIVQEAPRNYRGPILLTLVLTGGATLVILMIALTLHIAAAGAVAVLSATGGIGVTLKRPRSK